MGTSFFRVGFRFHREKCSIVREHRSESLRNRPLAPKVICLDDTAIKELDFESPATKTPDKTINLGIYHKIFTVDNDLVVYHVIRVVGLHKPERAVKAIVPDIKIQGMTAGIRLAT